MRKLISLSLAAVMLLSCTVTAFAAEDDPVEIGVYAKTEYSIDGEYTAPVENGSPSVTTPDGAVSVTNVPNDAVSLVVIPMEGEALTWIAGCVEGNTVAAYDIHFRDADGNRINASGAKINITVSGNEVAVSSVTTSGTDTPLTAETGNGKVSFTTDGSHYYVLTENHETQTKVEVENFGNEDVTDELKDAGYDTVTKVETTLRVAINVLNCDLDDSNTALYDVVLMYSTDGGKTWAKADEEHFPEDGKLLVSLPVPAGTDPIKHDYYVVHMFSKTAFGKVAGDVEYPAVTERDNHIEFYVTGLSPIMVGWTDTTSTAPDGHSFTNKASDVKATDATCTEAATYYVQCDNCEEHTTEKTVPVGEPLGHDWDEGTVTIKPTCDKDGVRTFTCKRDNSHTDTKAEPATGHSFTKYESNNDATCKKDGTETAKCDHGCGETDTRTDKGSKLGHKYEDGQCIRCGASQWIPETGDNSNIFLWAGILVLSLIALFFLVFWKRRKKDEA